MRYATDAYEAARGKLSAQDIIRYAQVRLGMGQSWRDSSQSRVRTCSPCSRRSDANPRLAHGASLTTPRPPARSTAPTSRAAPRCAWRS